LLWVAAWPACVRIERVSVGSGIRIKRILKGLALGGNQNQCSDIVETARRAVSTSTWWPQSYNLVKFCARGIIDRKSMRRVLFFLATMLLAQTAPQVGFAQPGRAELFVQAHDASGAVVPNARITLIEEATN